MSLSTRLFLSDLSLSFRASFCKAFGNFTGECSYLQRLLELRKQRCEAGDPAFIDVYERLAFASMGYSVDLLNQSNQYAEKAEALIVARPQGKNSFRHAKIIHLRCLIFQRLNHRIVALELAEDALAIYNKAKLVCSQRAALLHTLIALHKQVGVKERADSLAAESQVLDFALSVMNSRRRV